MFWKRSPKPPPSRQSGHRIDDLANRLQREGRIADLDAELDKFDPSSLHGAEKEAWYHTRGISAFRSGKRRLAFERFQEGLHHCPDSGVLLFSLGQEYHFRADTEQMFACFDRARFPKIPGKYALAQARYAYLWNRYDKSMSYIEPILPAYFELKVLDDTFLWIRGIPRFGQVWAYVAAFSRLLGDFGALDALTTNAEAECRDFDFDFLHAEMKAIKDSEFSELQRRLADTIETWKNKNWPLGYFSIWLGVLESQKENNLTRAAQILDAVVLTERDFPWLDDMRLLARCELSLRNRDVPRERDLQGQFLRRQPLLFEPDHAVRFNLLQYQENLKGELRRTIAAHGV